MKRLISIMAAVVLSMTAMAQQEYNIVFIGNSITYGATHQAPQKTNPVISCAKYLKEQGLTVHTKNMGKSGKTSRDFLPGRKGYWSATKKAAAELAEAYPDGQMVFSIMLGTNDAAIRTKKSCWKSDIFLGSMTTLIDSLQAIYPQAVFVLQQDPYFSPNVEKESGTKMDEACLKQLRDYWTVDQQLAKERSNVFLGSNDIYAFFEQNHQEMMTPEEGLQGTFYLHPNAKGAAELGKLWGNALVEILKNYTPAATNTATTGGSGLRVMNFGDSVAAGAKSGKVTYAQLVAQLIGGTVIASPAHAGDKLADIHKQVEKAAKGSYAPDVVFLEGGLNDMIGINEESGATGKEAFTVKTFESAGIGMKAFAGKVETIMQMVKKQYPKALVVYVLPHRTAKRNAELQEACWECVRKCAKKCGVDIVDVFHDSALSSGTNSQHKGMTDGNAKTNEVGTHPTLAGYKKYYVPLIMDVLKKQGKIN